MIEFGSELFNNFSKFYTRLDTQGPLVPVFNEMMRQVEMEEGATWVELTRRFLVQEWRL